MSELAERVTSVEVRVDNLEERFDKHEKKQNGHMQRIEAKMDKIYNWLLVVAGGLITSLALLVVQLFAGK